MKKIAFLLAVIMIFASVSALSATVFAADGEENAEVLAAEEEAPASEKGTKAVAAAAVVAVVAAAGAVGMAIAISKCASSMARQPEAAGKINSAMMLGLVFIETAIIYALIVAILIIFVL
ncbi:MAG: ATP synthase F0 subunit C [Clostridia bacterium]|nr:ATP synthase F0 subunit C [Clostridia bacterium]